MAKAPEDRVFVDLYENPDSPVLKYERPNSSAVTRFRLIQAASDPKVQIDIREFIRSNAYTGYTGRGITFTGEQIDKVIVNLKDLKEQYFKATEPKEKKKSTKKG